MAVSGTGIGRVLIVVMAAWYSAGHAADSASAPTLEQLQRRMAALERRVRQLEQAASPSGVGAPNTPSQQGDTTAQQVYSVDPALRSLARLKEAWQHMERGMSYAQVRTQLGNPSRLLTIDGKTIWYFSYEGIGSGSVRFSSGQRVVDWQKPPVGFW